MTIQTTLIYAKQLLPLITIDKKAILAFQFNAFLYVACISESHKQAYMSSKGYLKNFELKSFPKARNILNSNK